MSVEDGKNKINPLNILIAWLLIVIVDAASPKDMQSIDGTVFTLDILVEKSAEPIVYRILGGFWYTLRNKILKEGRVVCINGL